MLMFIIYSLGFVDKLVGACMGIFIILGFVTLCLFVPFYTEDDCDWSEPFGRFIKRGLSIAIICGVISIVTPSSKTIAAMYLIPKIVENKSAREIPDKALRVLNLKLDQYIEDLSGDKK